MTPSTTRSPTGKLKRGCEEYNRRHQQPDYPSIKMCGTGHGEHLDREKAKSADLVRARGKGMGTTPVAARETGSEKLSTYNWSHLPESVFLFRKLAFYLVNSFAVSVRGALLCETDQIIFQKV